MPTAPGNRSKGFLGRSPNAPEPSWSSVQTSLEQRAVLHTTTERFFVIFVLSCGSRDMRGVSLFTMLASHEVSSERVHAAKNVRILGMSASQIEPGSVRASQNRARAAQSERQNAKKTHEGKRFFFMGVRTTPVGTRKCAAEALLRRENAEAPGPP